MFDLAAAVGHVSEAAAPWVDVPGGQRRLLHCDPVNAVWALATRYEPGSGKERHHHTGPVFGFTVSGRWYYEEYREMYEAGSFIHEPAGSAHTLVVPADNDGITEAIFLLTGANLSLAADGSVTSVVEAASFRDRYLRLCAEQGRSAPAFESLEHQR